MDRSKDEPLIAVKRCSMTVREQRTLKRVLRTAERAGKLAAVAVNSITSVPTVVFAPRDARDVDERLWDALVLAEDGAPAKALASQSHSQAELMANFRMRSAATVAVPVPVPLAVPIPIVSVRESTPPAPLLSPRVSDDDPFAVRQWPRLIRSRSFAFCMPPKELQRVGKCCVYWMIAAPRVHFNLALRLAVVCANALRLPLLVVALVGSTATVAAPLAAQLREFSLACADHGLSMLIAETHGAAGAAMSTLLRHAEAHMCIADDPLEPLPRRWPHACVEAMQSSGAPYCPLYAVATNTVLPPRYAAAGPVLERTWSDELAQHRAFEGLQSVQSRPLVPCDGAWLARLREQLRASGVPLHDNVAGVLPGAGFMAEDRGSESLLALRCLTATKIAGLSDDEWQHVLESVSAGVRTGAVSAVELALLTEGEVAPRRQQLFDIIGHKREERIIELWRQQQQQQERLQQQQQQQ
jgi:hypothetical protein